jgi:peptidoglycan/LPS O-acetylase OafA/YrhL
VNPTNPLYAVFVTILAFLAVGFVRRNELGIREKGRYESIDGLRGFLAFFVFLFHSCISYNYLTKGSWSLEYTNFYTLLGPSSVQLFFMITSFLFFSKLLDSNKGEIDWFRFYLSRFLRLYPLYLFSIILVFIIVAYLSNGLMRESYWELFKHVMSWILFGLFGMANINEIGATNQVNAGVIWTLAFEWMFYLSMPMLALLVRKQTSIFWLFFSMIGLVSIAYFQPLMMGVAFIGGIIAAYAAKINKLRKNANSGLSTALIFACLACLLFVDLGNLYYIRLIFLVIIFVLIASGNNICGALSHQVSKALGDLSYSIYLLHGIVLYFTFQIMLPHMKLISTNQYWGIIGLIVPILIFICHWTYKLIEYPAMQSTGKVMDFFKSVSGKATTNLHAAK